MLLESRPVLLNQPKLTSDWDVQLDVGLPTDYHFNLSGIFIPDYLTVYRMNPIFGSGMGEKPKAWMAAIVGECVCAFHDFHFKNYLSFH